MLKFNPAVFAVGNDYQIIVTTKTQSFISIKIGDELFIDDSNGILKSASRTHNIAVPQELLNEYKHYTVIEKSIIKRLPYFTQTRRDKYYEYDFRPVPENNPKCYHIADSHNVIDLPVKAASVYGNIDFLILNGDVPEDSGKTSNFDTIFDIVSLVTGGNIPTVFSRGNHDLRGICAEKFAEYAPAQNGKTYYSFRLGNIWGLCLDCGEDKTDDHAEYGFTVSCHQFRLKETDYIKSVIKNAENEYNAPDVKHKIIVVHNPFSHEHPAPFNIEKDIFTEWCKLLKDNVKPDVMICGHTHRFGIYEQGCDYDTYGQPCTVVVGSEVISKHKDFGGAGFEFDDDVIKVTFTYADGKSKESMIKV